MRMIADLELATRVGMTTDEWIVRLCHKLRPGVGTSEAAPIASAFRRHHSSLWYWNFSGARAGVDGIIGSRSHPEIRRLDGYSNSITNPPFFSTFSSSLYLQRRASSAPIHMLSPFEHKPLKFLQRSSGETIFQTGEREWRKQQRK